MDKQINSIIDKRKKLGWSVAKLGEEANVNHHIIIFLEKEKEAFRNVIADSKKIIKNINAVLDNAIDDPKAIIPQPKETKIKWSRNYIECKICGTQQTKHRARGLCNTCYDRENEEKHKGNTRLFVKRGVVGKKLSKEYLIQEYIENEKSLGDIAKECRCTRQYIYKKINEYQIPTRSQSSAQKLALIKGKRKFEKLDEDGNIEIVKLHKISVNEKFFTSWRNEMAYVLGVIYTDGNIAKDRPVLSISQKEPELLEKIKKLMECDAKLYFDHRLDLESEIAGGGIYTLKIFNKKISKDLSSLGLTPNKSLSIDFPDIPSEYVRHFIRGCWDGDGSVFRHNELIRASFVSGSKSFIMGMLNELKKAGLPKRAIYVRTTGKNLFYSFKYHGDQCYYLYHYLYDKVPLSLYLERKYQVFNDFYSESYEKPILKERATPRAYHRNYLKTNPSSQQTQQMEELTIEAHAFAEQRNARYLSGVLKGNYLKVDWECQNGHRFKASFSAVKFYDERGSFCPICKKLKI